MQFFFFFFFSSRRRHTRWTGDWSSDVCSSDLSFAGGALGDRIGYRPVFVVGMAGSAVAYVVAAAAPTFGWLLAGRVMQGLAGGLVYGTAPAIVTAGADRTGRTRALGFLNGALGLAFAIG